MTYVTPEQIDQQIQLERTQISQGLKRLRDQTLKLEQQNYASASIYGIASLQTLLPLVVDKIISTNTKIHQGKYGAAFKDIHIYLATIEPLAAASIACKITFDKVFGYKEGCNIATNVCEAIGRAIEANVTCDTTKRTHQHYWQHLKKTYWHRAIGTQQKTHCYQRR